jgi:hypothetical protein
MGHTTPDCLVKIATVCDYCQKTNHWKPFCGAYLSEVYRQMKAKQDAESQSKPQSTGTAAAVGESEEQYIARVANEAVHASRLQATSPASAHACLSHISLRPGVPLGPSPQAIPNVFNR